MTDLVPPFPPLVLGSPREYVVRIARHYGADRLADELAALARDDPDVLRVNALPPLSPARR